MNSLRIALISIALLTAALAAGFAFPTASSFTPNLIITPNPTSTYIDYYGFANATLTVEYQNAAEWPDFITAVNLSVGCSVPWLKATIKDPMLSMKPGSTANTTLNINSDKNFSVGSVGIVYIYGNVTDYEGTSKFMVATFSVIGNPYCIIQAYADNWIDVYPNQIVDIPIKIENHGNCNTFVNVSAIVPSGFEWSADSSSLRIDAPTFTINENTPNRTAVISVLIPQKFYTNKLDKITIVLDAYSAGVYKMPQNETVNDKFYFTITIKNRGFYFPGFAFETLIPAIACVFCAYAARKGKRKE
jgi:hypothetical protein